MDLTFDWMRWKKTFIIHKKTLNKPIQNRKMVAKRSEWQSRRKWKNNNCTKATLKKTDGRVKVVRSKKKKAQKKHIFLPNVARLWKALETLPTQPALFSEGSLAIENEWFVLWPISKDKADQFCTMNGNGLSMYRVNDFLHICIMKGHRISAYPSFWNGTSDLPLTRDVLASRGNLGIYTYTQWRCGVWNGLPTLVYTRARLWVCVFVCLCLYRYEIQFFFSLHLLFSRGGRGEWFSTDI